MAPPPADKSTQSGITTDNKTGERFIPASVRADGSVRREIKVRRNYVPAEDVKRYETPLRNRGRGGVPGADVGNDDQSAAALKNAKRREARKKAAEAAKEDGDKGGMAEGRQATSAVPEVASKAEEVVDPEEQKAKDAKKLSKKLRQARELKDKKEKGDKLLPEQFEKVIRINELIRQLDMLGYDANGDKKVDS